MRKTLFVVATHGDEGYSIPVLKRLEETHPKQEYSYEWIIANPRALAAGIRFTEKDLNRNAPGDKRSKYYEIRRAAELVEIASDYNVVVDVHGSSSNCGATCLIPLPTYENLKLAMEFGLEKNVIWHSPNSSHKGPLAQHVSVPAIELEFGPKLDETISESLYATMVRYLTATRAQAHQAASPKETVFYDVYGKCLDLTVQDVVDFEKTNVGGEEFYAYMSNVYEGVKCYKMQPLSYSAAVVKYQKLGFKKS